MANKLEKRFSRSAKAIENWRCSNSFNKAAGTARSAFSIIDPKPMRKRPCAATYKAWIACSKRACERISQLSSGANFANLTPIKDLNPYTFPAGPELDAIIHGSLFGQEEAANDRVPPYSTNVSESSKVRSRLKSNYGHPIIVGQ